MQSYQSLKKTTHDDDGNDDINNGEDDDRHVICQIDGLDELSSKNFVSRSEWTNNFLPLSSKFLCTEIFDKTLNWLICFTRLR